ncbi:hypothetical protein Hypma_013263 [Hypsizygus marmoreus]|uniref:Uncharacterized protein n=1 Tax=Hypsizygus marmoreus TaxID=39966 RepID=A0A369JIS8_HYPMA|nr:hypothetical protein Hypma_013263 [Hypsizygus marmoreus]
MKPPRPKPSRKTSAAPPALQEIAPLPKLFHLCTPNDTLLHENTTPLSIGTNVFLSLQKISDAFQGTAFISDAEFVANCKYVIAFIRSSPTKDVTRVHQIMVVDIVENAIITFIIRIIPSLISEIIVPTSQNRPSSPLVMISLAETVDSHILQHGDFSLQFRMAAAYLLLRDSKEVQLFFSLWSLPRSVSSPNLALPEGSPSVQTSGHFGFLHSQAQHDLHRPASLPPSAIASPNPSLSPFFVTPPSSSSSTIGLNPLAPGLSPFFDFASFSTTAGNYLFDPNFASMSSESLSEPPLNVNSPALRVSLSTPNLLPHPHVAPSPSIDTAAPIDSHDKDIYDFFLQLSDDGGQFSPVLSSISTSLVSMPSGDLGQIRTDALGIITQKTPSSRESTSGPVARYSPSVFGEESPHEPTKEALNDTSRIETPLNHPPIVRALSQDELSRIFSGHVSNGERNLSESPNYPPMIRAPSSDGLSRKTIRRVLKGELSSGPGQEPVAVRSQSQVVSSRLVFGHDEAYAGPRSSDLPSYPSIVNAASRDELPTLLSGHLSNIGQAAELASNERSVYPSIVWPPSQDEISQLISGQTSSDDRSLSSLFSPDPNSSSSAVEPKMSFTIRTPALRTTPSPNHGRSSPILISSASERSDSTSPSRKTTYDDDPFLVITSSSVPAQMPTHASSNKVPIFTRRPPPRKQASASATITDTEIPTEPPLSLPPPPTKRKRDEGMADVKKPVKKVRGLGKSTRSMVTTDKTGMASSQDTGGPSSPKMKRRTKRVVSRRVEKENQNRTRSQAIEREMVMS